MRTNNQPKGIHYARAFWHNQSSNALEIGGESLEGKQKLQNKFRRFLFTLPVILSVIVNSKKIIIHIQYKVHEMIFAHTAQPHN